MIQKGQLRNFHQSWKLDDQVLWIHTESLRLPTFMIEVLWELIRVFTGLIFGKLLHEVQSRMLLVLAGHRKDSEIERSLSNRLILAYSLHLIFKLLLMLLKVSSVISK